MEVENRRISGYLSCSEMEAINRMKKIFLQKLFPSPPSPPPPPPYSSALDPETVVVMVEQQQQQPQPQIVPAVAPHNARQNPDWPVLVIGFCFSSAVAIAIAIQSLQTRTPLPMTFHLLRLAMACAVASLFVAKYMSSKLPDPARVLEHVGVLFGVTSFFFAITVSSPLGLKLIFWAIYACHCSLQ